MPKDTNEKELIANNLKYIGLDLEKIPEFLLEYKDVDFKPSKIYEENTFKVYRHIHLNDIQILIHLFLFSVLLFVFLISKRNNCSLNLLLLLT